MTEHRVHLGVQFDPQPEDREALRAWPEEEIFPDLATVAAGFVTAEFGGGKRYRVGDYVLILLDRLLDAAADLGDGRRHRVDLGDGPGFVSVQVQGDAVRVAWHVADEPAAEGRVSAEAFRRMAVTAAQGWVNDLLGVNPALSEHPEVRRLKARLREI